MRNEAGDLQDNIIGGVHRSYNLVGDTGSMWGAPYLTLEELKSLRAQLQTALNSTADLIALHYQGEIS